MTRALLAAAFCALLAACGTTTPTAAPIAPAVTTPSAAPPPSASAPPLHQVHDPGHVTGTLTGPCHTSASGQLPDPACTPGAYDPAVTAAVLCAPGYSTRAYRAPASETTAFKHQQAYPAYSIPAGTLSELDHLVSLELGGANDASDLWIEAGPIPNPKDAVENALPRWVCAVTGTEAETRLHAAQQAIAANWMTAEHNLGIT